MREEGVVHFIGLGVREHELHRIGIETGVCGCDTDFPRLHVASQTAAESLLPFATQHDIGVINGSPIAMGLLSGVEPDATTRPPEGERAHRLWQWGCRE